MQVSHQKLLLQQTHDSRSRLLRVDTVRAVCIEHVWILLFCCLQMNAEWWCAVINFSFLLEACFTRLQEGRKLDHGFTLIRV